MAVAGGGDAVAGKGGLVAGFGHAAEGGGVGGKVAEGLEPGVFVVVGDEAAVAAIDDHVHDAGDAGGEHGQAAGHGFEGGEALGFGFGGEDEGVGGLEVGGDVGDVAGEKDGVAEMVFGDEQAQRGLAGEVLSAAGAEEEEARAGLERGEAGPDAQEAFESFAAVELAGVGKEEGVGRQTELLAQEGAFAVAGGLEMVEVEPVGDFGDAVGGHADGEEFFADGGADGEEAVGAAEQGVAEGDERAERRAAEGQDAAFGGLPDEMPVQLAARLGAENAGLAEEKLGEDAGPAEHAQAADVEQVEIAAVAPKAQEGGGEHEVFAEAGKTDGGDADDLEAVEGFERGHVAGAAPGDDANAGAAPGEFAAEQVGVAFAAADDGVEGGGENADAQVGGGGWSGGVHSQPFSLYQRAVARRPASFSQRQAKPRRSRIVRVSKERSLVKNATRRR